MESRVVPPTPQAELRRSTRKMKTQERYSPALHYLLLTDSGEIEYYEEALQVKAKVERELAMDDEMASHMENQTWDLIELPESKRILHNKWVY